MALLREGEVYRAAQRARAKRTYATSERILKEQTDPREQRYDIFLCHTVRDANLVLGAKQILEELGHTVYVDWVEDPQLDRSNINRDTADVLRSRMRCCDSLFYLHTPNSSASKWMPWELGFFDGHNGNVAILPVVPDTAGDAFSGQEYLSLYPYVDVSRISGETRRAVWINRSVGRYVGFRKWKLGDQTWNRKF